MEMEFFNADLEISANEPLEPLSLAFCGSDHVISELTCEEWKPGEYFARFEINPPEVEQDMEFHNPVNLINAFCDLFETLPDEATSLLDRCTHRVIDLGYGSANHCPPFNELIPLATLKRMTDHSLELALTIYPREIRLD